MSVVRAVATLESDSGLPEDRIVNRFHFTTLSTPPTVLELDEIVDRMNDFYEQTDQWLSPEITGAWTITLYDMADPTPRVPIREVAGATLTPSATVGYPNEVAIVLSFQAQPISGVNQARRRNRVFIGPLTSLVGSASNGDIIPSSSVRNDLANSATTILGRGTAGVEWVVRSETDGTVAGVDNGWIDSAFDTVRRRGLAPASRTLFTVPGV